eukprot:c8375_g1_i1 orf=20-190(-)
MSLAKLRVVTQQMDLVSQEEEAQQHKSTTITQGRSNRCSGRRADCRRLGQETCDSL